LPPVRRLRLDFDGAFAAALDFALDLASALSADLCRDLRSRFDIRPALARRSWRLPPNTP